MNNIPVQVKILFVVAFILFLIILLFSFGILSNRNSATNTQSPTVTLPPNELTTQEQAYPTAKPQPFHPTETRGALVITTEPEGAMIWMDLSQSEAPDEELEIPSNVTPFTVENIPTGKYLITTRKDGFVFEERSAIIEPGKVTRLHIDLIPLGN